MEGIRENIGKQLSNIRKKKGMSQAELAELSGVCQSHIARIENGKYNVGVDTIGKLTNAMGVKLTVL